MSGGQTDVLSIFVGFVILLFILVELHGYSAASGVFAIPVLILSGLVLFISFLFSVALGAVIGAAAGGVVGLLVMAIVVFWLFKGLGGVTAQNYLLFAVLLVALLLVL